MSKTRFKITSFTNNNGSKAWRLSGTLHGDRIRKNFKTRKEAVTERQVLEVERLNGTTEGQTVWTPLTMEENNAAISATNRLKHSGSEKSLDFAVDYFLSHYKEVAETKTVTEAVEEYIEMKGREEARGIISAPQLKSLSMFLRRFSKEFGTRVVGELRVKQIKNYLEGLGGSLKTWNNRRGYLSTFFKFCLAKKYVPEDPILEIPNYKIKKARSTAETLSAKDTADFMEWIEAYRGKERPDGTWTAEPGCMVPYFALTLFAGIRPDWQDGEIGKLQPKDIRLDTGVILIEPEVSKVNEKRTIKIQPNLRLWLERYPLEQYPIIPLRRFRDMWLDVRKEKQLAHDVLRHTYISMTVGAFRSVGDAALQAGNSEAVIRKHYLDLYSVEEADKFWRIVPKGVSLPKAFEKKEGRYVVPENG